nr:citrate/2-methylcitrate synthase [uncultured Peptostreptococcus sp.]
MCDIGGLDTYVKNKENLCNINDSINRSLFDKYGVKRGLRDEKGQGVLTGLTNISLLNGTKLVGDAKVPTDGFLLYRGYDIIDLVHGARGRRYIFEEAAYLLLFGQLPNSRELDEFKSIIANAMSLPPSFTRDIIMKAATPDIMNNMTRSILTLSSYDSQFNNLSVENVLKQCLMLIATFPMMAVYGYHAYNHYENDKSMYIHRPDKNFSLAENLLRMLRPNAKFSPLEAEVLDIALMLHMEHGGGNNSTFTTRVVTSSGSDTYSAIAAAMSSLKGKKHGGANLMVINMIEDIKAHISDYENEEEIEAYLKKILNKEAFDKKGLIYGMGHAVYTLSDPREVVFKRFVEMLAKETKHCDDFRLYNNIEKIAPRLIQEHKNSVKPVSPNVDFYSGFVYDMLGIPRELFTPLFAVARIVGWSAHRMEELISADKIIRPAYRSLVEPKVYKARDKR